MKESKNEKNFLKKEENKTQEQIIAENIIGEKRGELNQQDLMLYEKLVDTFLLKYSRMPLQKILARTGVSSLASYMVYLFGYYRESLPNPVLEPTKAGILFLAGFFIIFVTWYQVIKAADKSYSHLTNIICKVERNIAPILLFSCEKELFDAVQKNKCKPLISISSIEKLLVGSLRNLFGALLIFHVWYISIDDIYKYLKDLIGESSASIIAISWPLLLIGYMALTSYCRRLKYKKELDK